MHYSYDHNGNFRFQPDGRLWNPAWANVLTNGNLSCTVTERFSGNVWYGNARELRVTPWLNDPNAEHGAERLSIGGVSLFAANDGFPCEVVYGFGFARWKKRNITTTVWIDPNADTRVITIEKRGRFTVEYDGEFVLGENSRCSKLVVIEREPQGVRVRSTEPGVQEYRISADGEFELTSKPGLTALVNARISAEGKLTILSGFGDLNYSNAESVRSYWRQRVQLGHDPGERERTRAWLIYQTLACRVMARCSLYQSGGAYGFRDQLQDVSMLVRVDSGLTREHIMLCASHQYEEGDVQHWWHPPARGVRTRCSDDLLWLVWAVCEYAEHTGDRSLPDAIAPYLLSEPLSDDERDRYESPETSGVAESVARHCERALNLVMERGTDERGLLRIGSGDWNDGFDKMGGGSSVWLTWFAASVFSRYARLGAGDVNGAYSAYALELGKAANSTFNGKYYERAYFSDGSPLPILDSVAQSWATLSGFGDPVNSKIALESALRTLYDRESKLVRLFEPPFSGEGKSPGYVSSYLPGMRENGGQYTHAAVWLAMACMATPGLEPDGRSILRDLLPYNHMAEIYRAEPFVLAGDVSAAPGSYGRAGWTWYTGASGWLLRSLENCEGF
ncbi:MAG: hypothetical protein LBC65_02795 [Oscillospiraceae bacterium]|jgi:cyclic beta-1,2-glucan synthetase|nr:hypothetical protein [Oscillospiraceae bacterium]